jgi:hypothetical protein
LIEALPVSRHRSVDAAALIFQMGETSGADMLAGFVFAHALRPQGPQRLAG